MVRKILVLLVLATSICLGGCWTDYWEMTNDDFTPDELARIEGGLTVLVLHAHNLTPAQQSTFMHDLEKLRDQTTNPQVVQLLDRAIDKIRITPP